jgi:hypothetical protein
MDARAGDDEKGREHPQCHVGCQHHSSSREWQRQRQADAFRPLSVFCSFQQNEQEK